jgi:excinuclease ABC subunit C
MELAIEKKLDTLPARPGVYLFRDHAGATLYVGKASNLKSRVRSYFQAGNGDSRYFIERLQHELADIETFVAESEKEAALLENSLIKQHQPRYNVKLRDDKDYLSLRLDPSASWPRLEVVRRPEKDGSRYFGPYHSATAARSTLRLINRHFQLRTCTDAELESRSRPCLQYQIKRCPAPCVMAVPPEQYAEQVRNVSLFLDGRHDELVHDLEESMQRAAESLAYELAATYRDQLHAVQSTQQSQRVSLVSDLDQDVFGYFRQQTRAELAVLMVRHGRVVGVRTFGVSDLSVPDDELIGSFVGEYYGHGSFVPDEVLIPTPVEAAEGMAELLSEQRGARTQLLRPMRGPRAQLLRMAMENAAHAFREKARAEEEVEQRLAEVQRKLRLPTLPRRFECVDVSHLGGEHTVAVVVAFCNGEPERKRYRSFKVRGVQPGDDYGAMQQVLTRRFKRGKEGEAGWELPQLLVVDGGRGQLGIARQVLLELGLEALPVVGLAKEKDTLRGEHVVDRVYLPGQKNPIVLSESRALNMLAYARDEAHRASNALRIKQGKARLQSGLDAIRGIGPKTRRLLLKTFGALDGVIAATEEALVDAGATRRQAQAIRAHYHGTEPAAAVESEEAALDHAFEV